MNKIGRLAGYFVDVTSVVNQEFKILVGRGFVGVEKDMVFLIKYDNEFCTLYEQDNNGKYNQVMRRDISTELRSKVYTPDELMTNMRFALTAAICGKYNIDKSYVYFEESN